MTTALFNTQWLGWIHQHMLTLARKGPALTIWILVSRDEPGEARNQLAEDGRTHDWQVGFSSMRHYSLQALPWWQAFTCHAEVLGSMMLCSGTRRAFVLGQSKRRAVLHRL